MAITTKPTPVAETAAHGEVRLRERMLSLINDMERGLSDLRRIVNHYGRSNLVTELGASDAADMLALYLAVKDVLEMEEIGKQVETLP